MTTGYARVSMRASSWVAFALLTAAAAIPALVTSCSDDTTTDSLDPTKKLGLISADGGRVDGPLGASIVIPPGALTADTEIGIALAEDGTYTALPDAATPLGAVFAFTPLGLTLAAPAEITLPSGATIDTPYAVLRAADAAAPWTLGPTSTLADGGTVSFATSQLSLCTVVGTGDGGAAALFPDGMGDGCSADVRASRWTTMLAAALTLPNRAAGLDLAGASKTGITRAEVETQLCAGVAKGKISGDDTDSFAWGDGSEVSIAFDTVTGAARFAALTGAYTGALEWKGVDGTTPYVLKLGVPLSKAGAPIAIPWTDATALGTLLDDLDRSLRATFTPTVAQPATPCTTAPATCERGGLGTSGYLYLKTFGLVIWVANTADTASNVSRIDVYETP